MKKQTKIVILLLATVMVTAIALAACTPDEPTPSTAQSYTLTFVADEITVKEVSFDKGATSVDEPAVPQKKGYNGAWESYTLGDRDLTVHAVYTAIEYTITYRNAEDATHTNPATYTVEDKTIVLTAAQKKDFEFVGWYTDKNCSDGNKVESLDASECKNVELWASWKLILPDTPPYVIDADGNTLTMGSYPQSRVIDPALCSMLNGEIGYSTPSVDNADGWTDYGYYFAGEVSSYAWYIDVDYSDGNKYRGVYFIEYRPYHINDDTISDINNIQKKRGYETSKVYWFKFEPIIWNILSDQDGKIFLMSSVILDSQAFQNNFKEIDGEVYVNSDNVPEGTFANNYEYSSIRAWLNHDFYNTAFDSDCKKFIVQTQTDNGIDSTLSDNGVNGYVCNDTLDRVFLLSYRETNGFGLTTETRKLQTTPYAQCQGAYTFDDNGFFRGYWWLRSPNYEYGRYALYVDFSNGRNSARDYVYNTQAGVVPAMNVIKL